MSTRTVNKLICHFCGGGAINLSDQVVSPIADLGPGFADIVFNYLDLSYANISKIEPRGDFWKIETSQHGKAAIDGSGGERKINAADIQLSARAYLDNKKYLKVNPNEFHVVVSSFSGGSGNVIMSVLTHALLSANIPTIVIGMGDSSNGLFAINTLNTLASLNQIALRTNKPLGVVYVNNHGLGGGNPNKGILEANKLLKSYIGTLALFASGTTEDLDNQDIRSLIDQSYYTTLQIKPGVYGLQFFTNNVIQSQYSIPTVARTLTVKGVDFSINIPLLHHKVGYVSDEEAISAYKNDNATDGNGNQFPLHMVMFSDFFNVEAENLKQLSDDAHNIANSINPKEIQGSSKSKIDDDLGLVF